MKTPVVRSMSWLLAVPQFIILALVVALSVVLFQQHLGLVSISVGAILFLTYSYLSRWFLLKHHRRGMRLIDQGAFQDAIYAFEQSYNFFSKYPWIDRLRFITMLTPAKQSFREMALVNSAFCYAKLGEIEQTKWLYEKTLQEFPDSSLAKAALDFIYTVEQDAPR